MAQIDEIALLKALRQPWVAPRQIIAASQPGATHKQAREPRSPSAPMSQRTAAHQAKPRLTNSG